MSHFEVVVDAGARGMDFNVHVDYRKNYTASTIGILQEPFLKYYLNFGQHVNVHWEGHEVLDVLPLIDLPYAVTNLLCAADNSIV